MYKRLSRNFYTQNTLKLAKEFLGKFIVRKIGKKKRVGMIVETEAYVGPQDRASHAFGGKKTPRNRAEYLIGGHIYIYLVYGMYWQFNIATGKAGAPECVLIRALEPILDSSQISNFKFPISNFQSKNDKKFVKTYGKFVKIRDLANGPGKLCRWLRFNKSFYGEDLTKSKRIWLEDRGVKIKKREIIASPRVGIDYAGPVWSKKPWRFYIKNNPFISRV
jgi:DNA-3-methyladenine glycosylase